MGNRDTKLPVITRSPLGGCSCSALTPLGRQSRCSQVTCSRSCGPPGDLNLAGLTSELDLQSESPTPTNQFPASRLPDHARLSPAAATPSLVLVLSVSLPSGSPSTKYPVLLDSSLQDRRKGGNCHTSVKGNINVTRKTGGWVDISDSDRGVLSPAPEAGGAPQQHQGQSPFGGLPPPPGCLILLSSYALIWPELDVCGPQVGSHSCQGLTPAGAV